MSIVWPRFHARTWYQDRISARSFPPLDGDRTVDVAIIGAGLAGLSTAASLRDRGHRDVIVLEAGQPGEGASGRNGGFVFGGFSLGPAALSRQLGRPTARRLQAGTHEAVRIVRSRCEQLGVAPDGEGVLLADWFKDDAALDGLSEGLSVGAGLELQRLDAAERSRFVRSERYGGALFEPEAFHFNPLAYVSALAQDLDRGGITIHGNSPVLCLEREQGGWQIDTAGGRVRANRVVVSTGGYDRKLVPRLVRSIQPIGTYIAVTEPLSDRLNDLIPGTAAIYDTRFAFDYYRRVGDRLLWGGRISIADRSPEAITRLMRRDLGRVFPELRDAPFSHAWGGWMSYARHQMPILGELEPGLWAASAFGGHGMAPTTFAGTLMADALCGRPSDLDIFARWGPRWAGGALGRGAAQFHYWWQQARDAMHTARARG